jgi:hypothetical protein
MSSIKYQQRIVAVVIFVLVLVMAPMMASAQSPGQQNLGVSAPSPELTAAWWQRAVSIPASQSPITDTSGAKCDVGQSGPVWFLVGTTGGDPVTRDCTIPKKKAILVPIVNAEWSVTEANGGPYVGGTCFVRASPQGTSEEALRACAIATMDRVTGATVEVDGVSQSPYRVQSPLFIFKPVPHNVFAIPRGETQSVADGFWILLEPLSVGQHTIHFHGVAEFPEYEFTLNVEATYNLTIK